MKTPIHPIPCFFLTVMIAWVAICSMPLTGLGQAFQVPSEGGSSDESSASGGRPISSSKPAADGAGRPGRPGDGNGADKEGKPDKGENADGQGDGKKDGKKDGKGSPDTPATVMRPDTPPEPPDPSEFDQRPDPDGRIRFHFRNQPWPDFLRWLSDVGGYTLDWQQLPGGYLNLVTHRSYTLTEANDLVNRMLFERGYTMLVEGQVMTVVSLDKLDPSMLPRIEDESELMDLPPYNFAKITFAIPKKLKAEVLAEDVKPLLSKHGKSQPLVASNRLLVIDAIANLRDVSRLINAEHAAADSHQVPREFMIRHVRADYVADQVMILLGLDPSSRRSPSELQVEQQRLQLFMQMQQRGKDVSKFLRGDNAPTVFLTVNKRINSILVNASPEELQKIEQAIEQLDVPSGAAGGSLVVSAAGEESNRVEMRRYALVSLKAESVVTALKEIGDLDPRTMLQMDSDAKVIFASATMADHEKISAIIERLDGAGREVEVIWLKRLPVDQVVVTIRNLLQKKEDDDDSNSRRGYSSYWYRGGDDQSDKEEDTQFRVEGDIENNRLILYANKQELEAVNNLLVKLGELPGENGNPNTIRVQEARGEKETLMLFEQLKKAWPANANPLLIESDGIDAASPSEPPTKAQPQTDAPAGGDSSNQPRDASAQPRDASNQPRDASGQPSDSPNQPRDASARPRDAKDELHATGPKPGEGISVRPATFMQATGDKLPPISLSLVPDGRIVISSKDTAALDAIEEMIVRISPPPKNFRVFYLKHALASMVQLNLEEYFENEADSVSSEENWMRAWMGMGFKKESSDEASLGRRRPVRFIYDVDTNSILVRDATPQQLETIEELIEIYDQAPSEDSISTRRLRVFKLEYSEAETVAATLKEVFRDLLSSKDKEFAGGGGDKEKQSTSSRTTRFFGGTSGDDSADSKPTTVKATFQGALSVGTDSISNTLIVSAQEEWMPAVEEIIEYLDKGAKPDTTVVVHSVSVPMNADTMRAISDLMRPWRGNKKPDRDSSQGKPAGGNEMKKAKQPNNPRSETAPATNPETQ